ncbi:hypothetical protein BO99DRAFT_334310, partial [Aspergillus violaceofuscus CBS 115571]
LAHTTTGCGKQGFPSAQPYLSHTPGANPFCCMFLLSCFDAIFINLHAGVQARVLSSPPGGRISNLGGRVFWPTATSRHSAYSWRGWH